MRVSRISALLFLLLPVFLFSGCSTSFAPAPETPVQTAFGSIGGLVHGGQQPIAGAHVYAYQTSTTAYGGASTSLIQASGGVSGYPPTSDGTNYYVPTDGNGSFQISSATACTSGTVVYLYSVSGQPTTGVTNPNAGLMAVLGTCPASGLLVNAIVAAPATSAQIYINEVSTVAAAYALAGFAETSANVVTDALHIGALTTATAGAPVTDALAQTGIQNAGANAGQMYSAVVASDGGAGNNGSMRAALATTPNGNGTVPQMELDTLANILAACINSASSFTACSTLFGDIKSSGATGTAATDTATAALYIAHNPTVNVTALYNMVGSTADPFTPALTAAPTNFTVALYFTGGGLGSAGGGAPHNVAIDGSGNVWAINSYNGYLCNFTSLGVPISSTGYTGNGMSSTSGATSVALDAASANVWVANFSGNTVSRFSAAGVAEGNFVPATTAKYPQDVEFDGSGNAWVSVTGERTSSQISKVSSTGTVLATATLSAMDITALALQAGAAGNVWTENEDSATMPVLTNAAAGVPGSPYTDTGSTGAYGIAIDAAGDVWVPGLDGNVGKLSSTGAVAGTYATGVTAKEGFLTLDGIAIDGAGQAWMTSPAEVAIYELSNTGANLSTSAGFAVYPYTGNPDGIAVDGSGNVWFDDDVDSYLHEIVGASVPVATPLAYGAANNLLGTRP